MKTKAELKIPEEGSLKSFETFGFGKWKLAVVRDMKYSGQDFYAFVDKNKTSFVRGVYSGAISGGIDESNIWDIDKINYKFIGWVELRKKNRR